MSPKKKTHAGRKPAGPFANNTSQLTIRMPDDLRAELEKSANKKGWSLTQELLWRVRSSYRKQREEERRSPAARAISYIIGCLADRASFLGGPIAEPRGTWSRTPFIFYVFRLAVEKVLRDLAPVGDIEFPDDLEGYNHKEGLRAIQDVTPEKLADDMAGIVLNQLVFPSEMESFFRRELDHVDGKVKQIAEFLLDTTYGMADAARDLEIRTPSQEPTK